MPEKFEAIADRSFSEEARKTTLQHVRNLLSQKESGRGAIAAKPDAVDKVIEASSRKDIELREGSKAPQDIAGTDLAIRADEPTPLDELPALRMKINSIHEKQTREGKPIYPTEL